MTVKVLHVLNGLGHGGAEAFVMNVYRNIDTDKVQFDFLVRSRDNSKYEKEVKQLGGKIFLTSSFPKNFIRNWKETKEFFKHHYQDYDVVHVHANSLIYLLPLKLAKKHGIKCRIIHSHSTQSAKTIYKAVHSFNKKRIEKYASDFFACSEIAGKWMFDCKFKNIKNAIDTEKFLFNEKIRKQVREELGLNNKFIVGHTGRFTYPKNHTFLLDIFNELLKYKKESVLLLLGDGELKDEIYHKAENLGILDKVLFLGAKDNVNEYLNAFDIFVFPSHFEGLPVSLIEAQATGINCVISDTISDEICISSLIHKLSLKNSANVWAREIIKYFNNEVRQNNYNLIVSAGFDMQHSVLELQNFYINVNR